jgi:hypothetical protein
VNATHHDMLITIGAVQVEWANCDTPRIETKDKRQRGATVAGERCE